MSIVVDAAIHPYRGKLYCHMASDIVGEAGLRELHAFALFLGLRRDWFQDKDMPHYDLAPSKRARALAHGAKAISITECATLIGRWREWKQAKKRMFDLRHGDALAELLKVPANSAGLVLFSPPYNIGKAYAGYDDQRAWPDWYDWMRQVVGACYRILEPGGTLAINVPTVVRWQREHRHADSWSSYDPTYANHVGTEKMLGKARTEPVAFRLYAIMETFDKHMREPIIWVKGANEGEAIANGYQMGCDSDPFLRSAHEMILLGSKDRWYHRGGTGRRGDAVMPDLDTFKDVWFVPGESSAKHPAPFPVEIPRRLIKAFTHAPDALVVDPFCGIGSSGVAAVELKRPFIGVDQSAQYLKIAEDRAQAASYRQLDMLMGL